ncbi:hypothetical protein [Pedobacter sp. WC2423]|uniref:hypothetical protein n=1 Tax=Pedobacter sp. WC2423 TaxID=3234142 RepID=UPI003465EB7E
MKQGLLSLLFVSLFTLNVRSQSNSTYSIGFNAFSYLQLPGIENQDPLKYITTKFNGGLFKIDDRQINYRLTGRFIEQSVDFKSNCINCNLINGKVTDYAIKIGFEKNLNYSNIQPYFAFDIGYRYNRFKGLRDFIDLQRTIALTDQMETIKNGLTLSPALGIRITPVEQLSIFAEGSFDLYFSHLRIQTVAQNTAAQRTETSASKKEFLLSPVTVGLQFHLGSRN